MNLFRTLIIGAVLFTALHASDGWSAELCGIVVDSESQAPLIGVVIRVPNTRLGAVTDANGAFTLIVAEPGTYTVEVMYVGYVNKSFDIVFDEHDTEAVRIALVPEPFVAESVVVTAAKNRRRIVDSAETISVITGEDLEQRNATTITGVLRDVPGVSLNHGPNPDRERPEIRGMNGERILLSIDGAKMNLSTMSVGDSHVMAEDIARIEIVKGPSSALYGSSAMGGVINIITKEPRDLLMGGRSFGSRLKYTYAGLSGTSTENLQLYGILGDRFDMKAGITRRDGKYLTLDSNDSSKLAQGEDASGGNIKLDGIYRISARNKLKLQYERYTYNPITEPGEIEPTSDGTWYDYRKRDYRRNLHQAIYTVHGLNALITGFELRVYRQLTEVIDQDEERTDVEGFPPVREIVRERDNNKLTTYGGELKSTSLLRTGGLAHVVTSGAEFMYDSYRQATRGTESYHEDDGQGGFSDEPDRLEPVSEARSPDTEYAIYSAYVQDELYWGERLILIPGLRIDSYQADADESTDGYDETIVIETSSSETALSPKIGVVGKLTDTQSLTLNVSRGFRVPSKGELYYAFNMANIFYIVPNPELKPESCINYELSHKIQNAKISGSTGFFFTRYSDFIGGRYLAPAPGTVLMRYQFINKDRVDMWGIESSYRINLPRAVSLATGFTFHHGKYADTGSRLEGLNKPKITLSLEYAPVIGRTGIHFTLSGRYVGPMDYYQTTEDDQGAEVSVLREYEGHTVCDIGAAVAWGERYRVNLFVNNVLDREYQEFSNLLLPSPRRNISISVSAAY